jgi:hypothetical protein
MDGVGYSTLRRNKSPPHKKVAGAVVAAKVR